jgi:iron complex outermembrane recepter protein
MNYRHMLFAAVSAASLWAGAAAAQDTATNVEELVVTGTRVQNRSALETAAPVDVIGGADLQKSGVTEVNQALSIALPSFNFPRPGRRRCALPRTARR